MDLATVIVLAIVVCTVAAFILLRIFKKATMEELRLHYGEKMLLDDDNCTLEVQSGSGIEELPNIFIRVTNKRIIISQRGRGRSGRHMLKYVIRYEDTTTLKGPDSGTTKKEYIVCRTEPDKLSITESGAFRIELPPGQGPEVPALLQVKTDTIDNYRDVFRLK
jgi:hypothetical protein